MPLEEPLGSTVEPRLKNTEPEHDVTVEVKCLMHCALVNDDASRINDRVLVVHRDRALTYRALVNDAPCTGAPRISTQRTEH